MNARRLRRNNVFGIVFKFIGISTRRRGLENRRNQIVNRIGRLRNALAEKRRAQPSAAAIRAAGRLETEIAELMRECDGIKAQRKELPTHITVGELAEEGQIEALAANKKLFADVMSMIAYRAETRMVTAVAAVQGKKVRPRLILSALFQSEADIIPDLGNRKLRVRILGSANHAADAAVKGLLDDLNKTETTYPGTNLTLVYELP